MTCPSPVTSVEGLDDISPQVFNFFDADTHADEAGNHSDGDWDFLIEVVASSMDAPGDAILDSLSQLEGVGRTNIMISFYDFEGRS